MTFGSFQSPTINQAGEVMVHGLLTVGGDVTNFNNNGIWLVDPDGQWRLVARAGDQVEGMASGVRYYYFLSDPLQYEGGVIVPVKLQGSGLRPKTISNTPVAPLSLGGDVDGDGKIGGAESLFILGQCAGPL